MRSRINCGKAFADDHEGCRDAARRPPIPTDEEVIETCEALTSYAGSNPVCLVTGDLNMQTLAQSRAVDVQRMPDDTMQRLGSGD